MNLRTKLWISIVMWFVSGSLLGLGALYLTEYFLIPLIIVAILIGNYCLYLKCPNCGKHVLLKRVSGTKLYFWTACIPDRCPKCGIKLKGRKSGGRKKGRP